MTEWIPSWVGLRRLGASRVVKSASVWAIVVPIAAKLLHGIDRVVEVRLFDHVFALHLALPFSWRVLFGTSLAFFVANLIYAWKCPELIKDTATYKDFSDQQRSALDLAIEVNAIETQIPDDASVDYRNTVQNYAAYLKQHPARATGLQPGGNFSAYQAAFAEIYALVIREIAYREQNARLATAFFYLIGMGGLAVLLVQNVVFVLRDSWR